MINSKIMRYVLWVGVVFNALVALMLVFPTTFDSWATLPPIGSDFYRWMLTFFVMLFSATYAWIALEPTISRPIVALAAIGKTGAFIIALVCLLLGDIHIKSFFVSAGDLAFAIYFFLWLHFSPVSSSNA